MDGRRHLPHGIALVRVQTAFGKIVVCSDQLSGSEEHDARVIAAQKVRDGARAVVLTDLDLVEVREDASPLAEGN